MNTSLNNFVREVTSQFGINLNTKINILEIGCGTQSLFADNSVANIVAIDKSVDVIMTNNDTVNLKFKVSTIQDFKSEKKFDLIVDAHCLHCLLEESTRENALKNIYSLLANDGYFISETMIQPAHEFVLFKDRIIKKAYEIEHEFLFNNLKIKYFFINPGLYFEDDDGYKNKCDVLRIVAQK